MSSINQIISEIAHSIKQANSIPVRRAIKLGIIHARNELIRRTYQNNNYTDRKLLMSIDNIYYTRKPFPMSKPPFVSFYSYAAAPSGMSPDFSA